ncbi:hypothetical protein ABEF95_014120 [Exophiala dermatitidis]
MPTHASNTPASTLRVDLGQAGVACPAPLTPPPEINGDGQIGRELPQQGLVGEDGVSRLSMNDNTAAGMSLRQEESLYSPSGSFQSPTQTGFTPELKDTDKHDGDGDIILNETGAKTSDVLSAEVSEAAHMIDLARSQGEMAIGQERTDKASPKQKTTVEDGDFGIPSPPAESHRQDGHRHRGSTTTQAGIPPIDQELDWASHTKDWDFSRRRLHPQYPSVTFQPYSKFKGTQQSDRQIYNVEVTILTVDIKQATMSGYLQICGLTPDHPTLTTFFTGEIIGGPNQKYSFRTKDPAWGASDKTDLTHWARFPAWRPLSLHAKRNINFVYPLNHEDWWQQEYIFMRWKEHFLVPDYKLKSIQGASFEGFYYICFNQIEGRVSGIYFHSKSEKYQQLELKHEGKQGVWGRGVCPSIEFR